MYKDKYTWLTDNDNRYIPGVKKWNAQEQADHLRNIGESIQWNDNVHNLTDGATITWNYINGSEAKVTLGGNRTLSITNLPTGRVVYGCLEVYQDATGNRTLALPSPKTTNGVSISSTANSKSLITFRYDGTKFEFNISQHS